MATSKSSLAAVDGYKAMALCAVARTSLREFRNIREALDGRRKMPASARLLVALHQAGLVDLKKIESTVLSG